MLTVDEVPIAWGRSALPQSRSLRLVMVTVPEPLEAALERSMVKRVPLAALDPQGAPSVVPSAW